MRIFFTLPLLALMTAQAFAEPDPLGPVAADRNQANWAEPEAQARMADGDYDVQSKQQADAHRHEADGREQLARSSKRQDTTEHMREQ